ncbi:MAG: peroxidase [Gaiellales bacterium]
MSEPEDLLDSPLSLRALEGGDGASRMLHALQANILHAHVRTHLRVLALRIEAPYAARRGLSDVARSMKTAARQFEELHAYRTTRQPASAYVGVALSASGYERLQIEHARWPDDPAFREGIRRRNLGDPAPAHWQPAYRDGVDALVLVGSHSQGLTAHKVREVLAELGGSVSVVADEVGRTLTNADGNGIEHFGYTDGRSQPLFVEEDLEHERATTDGTGHYNPLVPLDQVLVRDPGVASDHCFGSFLIYRKLEQHVRAFAEQEARVARQLHLTGSDAERAGAMLVGRFEDGTPLSLADREGMANPIPNDFTFADDPAGARCPYAAHIRRMNPRTDGVPRTVLARRGQSYGERADNPNDGDTATKPAGGVGLLFLAMVARIEEQFESLQLAANGDDGGPFDPVAGQWRALDTDPEIALGRHWDDAREATTSLPLESVVSFQGGEYLFLPSVEFLVGLDDR